MLKRIFLFFLVLSFTTVAVESFGQRKGIVRNYNVEENLLSSRVYCAFQDSHGYMWFGTSNGVSKFNGISFQNFSISDGLCDNEILNIQEDSRGRVWFLSRNNCLSYYNNELIINSDSLNILSNNSANKGLFFMTEDNEHNLHFTGVGNEIIILNEELTDKSIIQKEVSVNDYIVPLNTKSGTTQYLSFPKEKPDSIDASLNIIRWIQPLSPGKHLELNSLGVSIISKTDTTLLLSSKEFPELLEMEKVYLDHADNLYCYSSLTAGKLYKPLAGNYGKDINDLPSKISYSSILVDRDNNQWFSSYTTGVHQIADSQKDLTSYQAYPDEQSTCLTLTPSNQVLVGVSGNRILKFEERKLIDLLQVSSTNTSGGSRINQITLDPLKNYMWCAGDFGIMRIPFLTKLDPDNKLGKFSTFNIDEVHNLYQTEDSLLLICGVNGMHYCDLSKESHIIERFNQVPEKTIFSVTESDDNTIWFENNDQLLYLKDGKLFSFSSEISSFKTKITSLHKIENDVLVVCTFGSGVYFIKDQKVIYQLSEQNGLLSNLCKQVFIDKNKHYLATAEGVVIYNWNGKKADIISTYSHLDGLPSNDINDVVVKDSLVYLASSKGLLIFNSNYHTRYKSQEKQSPPLYFKKFKSKNQTFDLEKCNTLTYDDTFVSIAFEALSYVRPDEIIYEYKLHQSDEEWIQTKNNSLEFPRFEAGNYDFTLRARKHDSDWSEAITLNFISTPAWWATWWFRTLVILALGFITFSVIRFYAKRKYERQLAIVQKEQALLEERNRISADMHDDLGSELTKIVILSRIARTKLGLKGETEKPIIDIDNAASDVVKKMNEIIWALNPTNDTLESLISYLQSYVNDYLDVRDLSGRVAMPDHIPELKVKAAFRRNVFLIVKECLHNIHKHAKASRVDVGIRISHEMEISIIENGVGFDMEKTRRFGNGLINMKKRANDINGDVEQTSSIGNGSSLIMTIPLTENHAFVLDKSTNE